MSERHFSDLTISELSPQKLADELLPWANKSLEAAGNDPEFWRTLFKTKPELKPLLSFVCAARTARKAVEAAIIVS